ncbi:hypothetical protein LTEGF4_26060 (plasmid) [Limnohabitans sp. TEGF004]|nr:hypothetical protein LTEGF4_26060 [Limnohabitans sp. TEGF004]
MADAVLTSVLALAADAAHKTVTFDTSLVTELLLPFAETEHHKKLFGCLRTVTAYAVL